MENFKKSRKVCAQIERITEAVNNLMTGGYFQNEEKLEAHKQELGELFIQRLIISTRVESIQDSIAEKDLCSSINASNIENVETCQEIPDTRDALDDHYEDAYGCYSSFYLVREEDHESMPISEPIDLARDLKACKVCCDKFLPESV